MRRYLKRLAFAYCYRARLAWWEVGLAKVWILRCRIVLWSREP